MNLVVQHDGWPSRSERLKYDYDLHVLTGVNQLEIKYSRHAREQMIARGISTSEVRDAISRGSKQLQGSVKILASYRYFCVVYKKLGNAVYVITVKPR